MYKYCPRCSWRGETDADVCPECGYELREPK